MKMGLWVLTFLGVAGGVAFHQAHGGSRARRSSASGRYGGQSRGSAPARGVSCGAVRGSASPRGRRRSKT